MGETLSPDGQSQYFPRESQQSKDQHALSCTHCRQRKVKCDKIYPCSHCQKSNYTCVFPERAKNAKKKRNGTKTSNDELLRRLKRMEDLIGRIEGEDDGKDESAPQSAARALSRETSAEKQTQPTPKPPGRSQSIPIKHEDQAEDRLDRFIGNNFLRSLTAEVEGLRQSMDDDVTDEEDVSSPSAKSPSDIHTPGSSTTFGSTLTAPKDLRLLHPPPVHMSMLCNFFIQNVDPVFKIMHIPTLRNLVSDVMSNMDAIPSGTYVEAILFAMYYGAITSLTRDECLQYFQDGKDSLLARYRAGAERALSNANYLLDCDLGTLQALTLLLLCVRSNDNSQYTWTMLAVAVRLAHSLGLHREGSRSDLTPFMIEIRRRVWWGIVSIDVRCSEDVATDPLILENTFNTKRPSNVNDEDMDPNSMQPLVEREGFTEMTKSRLSHDVSRLLWQIGYQPPIREGQKPVIVTVEQKMNVLREIESHIQDTILADCDTSTPIGWATSVVAQLIIRRLRVAIYHPLQYGSKASDRPNVSREVLLQTAVECIELAHLLDTGPMGLRWLWFFKTYVQWHALAAAFAELCVQTKGPLVERAWHIIDIVFDSWAERIADSQNGRLWRPIKKLRNKAQKVRNASQSKFSPPMKQLPLPSLDEPSLIKVEPTQLQNINMKSPTPMGQDFRQEMMIDPSTFNNGVMPHEGMAALNVNGNDGINWTEWDEFMLDYSDVPPNTQHINDAKGMETWW